MWLKPKYFNVKKHMRFYDELKPMFVTTLKDPINVLLYLKVWPIRKHITRKCDFDMCG